MGTTDMLGTVADGPSLSGASDEMSKKVRKPYTITKSRESWTEQEHDKFLEALQLFDRDWKKIEAFVGSKTVIQIRSHAQKYFLKVQKNGTGEHVPPPRPKRKSAQPYPQKAAKNALVSQVGSGLMPVSQAEPTYPGGVQPCAGIPVSAPAMPAWVHHMGTQQTVGFLAKGTPVVGIGGVVTNSANDWSDGNEESSSSMLQHQSVSISPGSGDTVLRAMPDFAEIYSFIGSVFDPNADDQLKKMGEMAPIDRETVLLLMKNLSINLSSPHFEEHKLFLSVYDMGQENTLDEEQSNLNKQLEVPFVASPPLTVSGDDTLVSGHQESWHLTDCIGTVEESEAREEKLSRSYHEGLLEDQLTCGRTEGDKRKVLLPCSLHNFDMHWNNALGLNEGKQHII